MQWAAGVYDVLMAFLAPKRPKIGKVLAALGRVVRHAPGWLLLGDAAAVVRPLLVWSPIAVIIGLVLAGDVTPSSTRWPADHQPASPPCVYNSSWGPSRFSAQFPSIAASAPVGHTAPGVVLATFTQG